MKIFRVSTKSRLKSCVKEFGRICAESAQMDKNPVSSSKEGGDEQIHELLNVFIKKISEVTKSSPKETAFL